MTENIVTGKKYRILTDAANDIWDRISFWTKASDVQYDDNTTAEANKAVAILKRNASYTIGTVAYEPSAPSWVLLRCTQAGTTAAVIPSTYSTISSVGTVITDGTARFTVYDVRPSGTLSNSEYQVPAMSLVNGLDAELTANGNKFYFDYQNDTYGYNTSASREAATFVPFGGSSEIDILGTVLGYPTSYTTLVEIPAVTKEYKGFYVVTAETRNSSPAVGIKINGVNTLIDNATWGTNIVNAYSSYSGNVAGVNLWYYNYSLKVGDILSAKSSGSAPATHTFFAIP